MALGTRFISVSLVFAAAAFAAPAWATPAQILIIRHAEKPDTGDDLSPEGYQHAQELVSYFQSNSAVTEYGMPAAIYAFAPSDDHSSVRGIETVTPLAQALGLKIHALYTIDEYGPLAKEILSTPAYDGKMVLICWEHKNIPGVAQALGATEAPSSWPGKDVFNLVWEINYSPQGAVTGFKSFAQDIPQP